MFFSCLYLEKVVKPLVKSMESVQQAEETSSGKKIKTLRWTQSLHIVQDFYKRLHCSAEGPHYENGESLSNGARFLGKFLRSYTSCVSRVWGTYALVS